MASSITKTWRLFQNLITEYAYLQACRLSCYLIIMTNILTPVDKCCNAVMRCQKIGASTSCISVLFCTVIRSRLELFDIANFVSLYCANLESIGR